MNSNKLFGWPRTQRLNSKSHNSAEIQGIFKKVGSKRCNTAQTIIHNTNIAFYYTTIYVGALCRAAYDGRNPTAVAEAISSWGQMDEVEIEGFKDLLKRFGCE